jgi:hypothetical protein
MKRVFIVILVATVFAGGAIFVQAQTNNTVLTLDDETRTFLRTALQDKWFKKENLVSTLLGGALAIAGGFAATWLAHSLQARHKRREEVEFSKNLLRAIRCELEALQGIYDAGIGKRLNELKEGQMFVFRLGLTQDWFTVFDSNAVHLGRIEGEVSRQIVTVYARLKQVIEEYRINNEYIKELAESTTESRLQPFSNLALMRKQQVEQLMLFQAKKIKEADQALKVDTSKLFAMLDQRGIK